MDTPKRVLLQAGDEHPGYAPCPACGDTVMIIHVSPTLAALKELVWTTCRGCERRGGSWYRWTRFPG